MRGARTITISILALGLLSGPGIGVAAQDAAAPQAPVALSAKWGFTNAGCCEIVETASDPRFDGDVRASVSIDESGGGLAVWSRAFTVTNDEGVWRGQPHTIVFAPDGTASTVTQVFIGEGAYDGSYAVLESATTPGAGGGVVLRGFIVEGEPPTQ